MMKSMWIALLTAGALLAQAPNEAERRKLDQLKKELQEAKANAAGQAIVLEDAEAEVEGLRSKIITRNILIGGQTMEFVSGMNVGSTLKGAPYSAEAVTETTQTLYDGNRITQKSSTKQYRDSEGRERREEGSPMNVVFISDPVAKASYTLHPDSMSAEKLVNSSEKAIHITTVAGEKAGFNVAYTATQLQGSKVIYFGKSEGPTKEEFLGTRLFDGVEAQGTRVTTTIAAGDIGNDRPIEIVDERWYSPDLQLVVMTRHADPRSGETIYKLTNIQRLDPVRSLFEIPRGYAIQESPIFERAVKARAIQLAAPKKEE